MTQGKIESILMNAPDREFGNKTVAGYFLSELEKAGVPKGKLKKLVRKGVVIAGRCKMKNGSCMTFYSLAE